jgi:hypothetical protein
VVATKPKYRYFACEKCGTVNPDFLAFGAGSLDRPHYYCLGHIPLRSRLKLWWQELSDRGH